MHVRRRRRRQAPGDAGAGARPACPANCAGFSLSGGVRYIDYNQLTGTNNVMGGLDVADGLHLHGVGRRSRAAASSTSSSRRIARCTTRSPRTAASCAPTRSSPSSTSPTKTTARRRTTTDLFNRHQHGDSMYGVLQSFRCTQFGIQCNGMPVAGQSVSGLTGCTVVRSCRTAASSPTSTRTSTSSPSRRRRAASRSIRTTSSSSPSRRPSDPVGVHHRACRARASRTSRRARSLNHSCIASTNTGLLRRPGGASQRRRQLGAATTT